MKIKHISALLFAFVLTISCMAPTYAAQPEETIIELGDGFYMIETLTQSPQTRAGGSTGGSKTGRVYYGGTLVGTATLVATFDISGSVAKATDAAITGSGSNGWSYDSGSTSCSGNKASGTAYFTNGSIRKGITLTISCSPDGTVS